MIEGALILLAGILVGRFLPGRRRRYPKLPKPPEPVCGCTHHYAIHHPETGKCNAGVPTTRYDDHGNKVGTEYRPCACQRYSGPEPMPTYYAPEIASEDSR